MRKNLKVFNILLLLLLTIFLTGCVKEEELTCDNPIALETLEEIRNKEFFEYINRRHKTFNGNFRIEYDDIIIDEAYNPGTKKISCNAQEKIYDFSWDYPDAHLVCDLDYNLQYTSDKKILVKAYETEYYWYTGPCHAYDSNGKRVSVDDIFYWEK